MIWAMAFAMVHIIPYTGSLVGDIPTQRASSLNAECFLPTETDFEELRTRMINIVARIICTHMGHFRNNYHDCVVWHIPHSLSE